MIFFEVVKDDLVPLLFTVLNMFRGHPLGKMSVIILDEMNQRSGFHCTDDLFIYSD